MTRSHSPEFCQISLCHSAYPELFALTGATVPDLRGLFLRGQGGNAAALGQIQPDEIKSHTHGVWGAPSDTGHYDDNGIVLDTHTFGAYWIQGQEQPYISYTGGVETRPINRAVRYLIRAAA